MNNELNFDGSIGHNLGLHFWDLRWNSVYCFCIVSIFFVGFVVFRNTFFYAVGSMSIFGAGTILSGCMMITGCKLIGIAVLCCFIKPSSNNSLFVPMIHGTV